MRILREKSSRTVLQAAAAVAGVAGITLVYHRVLTVNATTVALCYLMLVLAVAAGFGLAEAIASSVAAMGCLNYFFLPPVGTFTIGDPQNWVALVTFLVVAVVASQLSARARRRTLEATQRQHEMERLYGLSRSLLLAGEGTVAERVADRVAKVFDVPGVAFYDRSTDAVCRAGARDVPVTDDRLRDIAIQCTAFSEPESATVVLPVALGGVPGGSIALTGADVSDTALHAIANLAAIELERVRAQESVARAEAARENQELKATLLDALAHDFKTPLSGIKASATALLTDAPDGMHKELLTVIDEEADRLSAMVTETTQMARVEAGDVQLELAARPVSQIVAAALKRLENRTETRQVLVELPAALPWVRADGALVALALRQIVDNALKFSPPGSPISIRAHAAGRDVVLSVADRGPGIPAAERQSIFERFYRGRRSAAVPGTGMGLAIARQIVTAHGGNIRLEDGPGGGAEFLISLPAAEAM